MAIKSKEIQMATPTRLAQVDLEAAKAEVAAAGDEIEPPVDSATLELMQNIRAGGFTAFFFYLLYYIIAAVLAGALGTKFDGLEPFDHEEFTPAVERDDLRPLVCARHVLYASLLWSAVPCASPCAHWPRRVRSTHSLVEGGSGRPSAL